MPPPRRPRTGAAGSGSSSSGIVRRAHPDPERPALDLSEVVPMAPSSSEAASAGSGSIGEMLQKKAAAASSGAAPMVHPEKGAAGTARIQENPNKKAATASSEGVPTVHPGNGSAGTVSSGEMLDKMAASVGGAQMVHPGKLAAGSGSCSTGDMLQKKVAVGSRGGAPMARPGKRATGSGSSGTMLPKNPSRVPKPLRSYAAVVADCEESVAKVLALPSAKISQKHCTEDNADTGLSRGMLQKQISKVDADTGLSEKMLHEHHTNESYTAKNIQESDLNETVHASEEDTETKEAESLIKKIDESHIGEPVSEQEYLDYLHILPCDPPTVDLKVQKNNEELDKLDNRHALCRLKYYKYKLQQASMEELSGDELKSILDISEHDCNEEFLKKQGFFNRFEKEKTFDWFFHPDYVYCSLLVDYQCIVLKNHGYSRWSEYHTYLHSYEIEQEYVNYCEELSKQLKWMEAFVDVDRSSVKWDKISSRAVLEAIKIAATSFHKISPCLAFNAYYECKESICYDVWFAESKGVYYEIWRRVNEETSFKKALEEVYNLDRFPLRQPMMKAALEFDETMELMEYEFLASTEGITPEVKEDKAKKLIAQAVSKQVRRPKSYEEYIRKKIHIAHIIGILKF